MGIDFQFLRDCVRALRETKEVFFDMEQVFKGIHHVGDVTKCGTPACVIGHYVVWKGLGENEKEQNHEAHRILGLNDAFFPHNSPSVHELIINGLTFRQRDELFGTDGCDNARTKEQAIAYIQDFIVRHGGSLEDPKALDVCLVPDWKEIAATSAEAACPLT